MAMRTWVLNKSSMLLFLFELGWGLKLSIVGQISISELFLLIYVPLKILPNVKWRREKELFVITKAYVVLFCFQVLSECIVGNVLSNALKGLAITVVSYFHFMFLAVLLLRQKSLISVLILSLILRSLIWGTGLDAQRLVSIVQGEAVVYLKVYFAPLSLLISLYASIRLKYRNLPLLFSAYGLVLILLGARSSGGTAFLSGLLVYMMLHVPRKRFCVIAFWTLIACYMLYVYYVNGILSGEITSGNSWQILLCKNPYNPMELLMVGRSEMWVGLQAFLDSFWFGHGAWASDSTGRYELMMQALHGVEEPLSHDYSIPSHSVIAGSGMMNGVFAFMAMGYILFFFIKRGWLSLGCNDRRYQLVLAYYWIVLIWDALFSPQSHFRLSMPIAFAIIFTMYYNKKAKENGEPFLKSN